MYGLKLCPKCKKGHLYPVVTASASGDLKDQFGETGSIKDYGCDICGYKQKAVKQTQKVDIKDKVVSTSVKKTKKTRSKTKPKIRTGPKTKPKTKRKRTK